MKTSTHKYLLITIAIFSALTAAAIPAYATFPGKNGRIAFGRFDSNIGDVDLYTANPMALMSSN